MLDLFQFVWLILVNEKVFKIFEAILIILLVLVCFFYLNKTKKYVNLSKLKKDLINGNDEFFEGANQLFNPLRKFISNKTNKKRVLQKIKKPFLLIIKMI